MAYSDDDKLFTKFNVTRKDDGTPIEPPYFVLAYGRDPHARVALAAYAESCRDEMPGLSSDLRAALDRTS